MVCMTDRQFHVILCIQFAIEGNMGSTEAFLNNTNLFDWNG